MNKPATPLPWHVGVKQAEQIIYDESGWAVANATVYHGKADRADAKANAVYLVRAANAYPRLVEALRTNAQQPFYPSDNGERWDEGFARGFRAALAAVYAQNAALLRELGELGEE